MKTIEVHNYRDAIHYLFPVLKNEKQTLEAFRVLHNSWTRPNEEPAEDIEEADYQDMRNFYWEMEERAAWKIINQNCGECFAISPYDAREDKIKIDRRVYRVLLHTWFSF